MSDSVFVRNRSYQDFILSQGLTLRPLMWRSEAQGGHQYAIIQATGDEQALLRLLEWLRYEMRILDERGTPVWWGYVHRATLEYTDAAKSFDLGTMSNKIQVIWSDGGAGGTTAWASDTDSVNQFGTKERQLGYSNMTESSAERARDIALSALKYPIPDPRLGKEGDLVFVLLECKGWYDTLDWTYYDRDEGFVDHAPAGGTTQKVGWGFTSSEVAFTARTYSVSELNNKLNNLERGEKIAITGSASNDGALTVESTGSRERETITATSIAFLIEAKKATNEYRRASHDVARKLNNDNLYALRIVNISTLAVTANTTDTTLTLVSVGNLQSGDRIRIELDAGGYHRTFISGAPDTGANTLRIQDEMPSTATSGNDVDRVNWWVTNETDDVYYAEGTDYTMDTTNGKITVLSTGAIANNQILHVSYKYVEYRIEDANLGLGFVTTGDVIEVSGSASNNGYYRVLGTGGEGDHLRVKEAVADEGPGASVTIARGSNAVIKEILTAELPGATVTVTGWGSRVVQSFTIPSDEAWTANQIQVRARKVGNPGDSLRLGIRADSAGAPGSLLESVDVPATDIGTQLAWVSGQLLNTLSLAVGTVYWLSVGRSGTIDADNYYEVAVDEDLGYVDGGLKLYDGAAYQDRPIDADLIFRVLGAEETTVQIQELVMQEGQFLAGHDGVDTSGISTNQYRNGRTTALVELEDLLEIGTVNDRRLLATVTIDRYLRIREEDAEPLIADYIFHNERRITDKLGREVSAGSLEFVGKWMEDFNDLGTVNATWWARKGMYFIEGAEWIADTGEWKIQTRGAQNVWEIGLLDNA